MRRTDAAEWVLSLLTSPDRAASIAGDLAEQASSQGGAWFWLNLLRTTASLAWRDFAEAPFRVTGLALVGIILQSVCMSAISLVIAICFLEARVAVVDASGIRHDSVSEWAIVGVFLFTSFFLGKWLAKWAPQRELAVYVVIQLISLLPWILTLWFRIGPPVGAPNWAVQILSTILGVACTFAGIRRMRWQRSPLPAS
jgi:hypothetical protein